MADKKETNEERRRRYGKELEEARAFWNKGKKQDKGKADQKDQSTMS